MTELKKFKTRISEWFTFTHILSVVIAIASWLLATRLFKLEADLSAFISASVGILSAILLAHFESKRVNQVFENISAAVAHVNSANPSDNNAPSPMELKLGKEYATALIKEIYEIAASANKNRKNDQEDNIFKKLIDLAPIGMAAFDQNQKLVHINQSFNKLLNPPSDLIGADAGEVLDWKFQTDEDYATWLEICRNNKVRADNFWERVSLFRPDGKKLIGDVAAHYEKEGPDGIETIVIFIDRTKEYIADEKQMDFVALAAHELRGPITVIRGYLDVFLQEMPDVFTVEQRLLLQKMTVAAEQLSGYVNNILNVARIDQGGLKLHIRETDWRKVLKETYLDLFLRARAHGRILKLEYPASLPTVAVDRVSITEVINNLVDNAIKYSNEGGEIIIKAEENGDFVTTTVQDFGIGIPESVIGNLFKKFYRSHRSRQGVTGTGLGLYLCKVIVEAHGGNIWVRSKEGEGSTFGFDLPTYASIAETLKKGDNEPEAIKRTSHGWIKNHAMYKRINK